MNIKHLCFRFLRVNEKRPVETERLDSREPVFIFLYFCRHPVGAFVISTSQTSEKSVHTSTWSRFFFLNTLTQAKGGRLWEEEEAGGSTDKTLEGSRGLTSGEEEEEVHNGEQRICKNSFCILFFFFPNSCELRILRFFR